LRREAVAFRHGIGELLRLDRVSTAGSAGLRPSWNGTPARFVMPARRCSVLSNLREAARVKGSGQAKTVRFNARRIRDEKRRA
jgi:hypothetical protein